MSFESESINENVFFALDKFRNLDLRIEENKERLIDGLVKAIIVYDDHFEVFLTFDDSPITIPTSEEIESMKNSSDIASVTSPNYKKQRLTRCFLFFPQLTIGDPLGLAPDVTKDKTYKKLYKLLLKRIKNVKIKKKRKAESKMKIEMTGYNGTKAIAVYGNIKMTPYFIGALIVSCLTLVPAFIFGIYELAFIFLLPALLGIVMITQYIVNRYSKNFLEGKKVKHTFCLENGIFYKDGKEMKNASDIRLYRFRKFLFIETKKSYYRIPNEDYTSGSREEFLSRIKILPKRHVEFFETNKL